MDRFSRYFINKELSAGLLLLLATLCALLFANSPWQTSYHHLLNITLFNNPLTYWINDGLMAIFFFQVGLELKRERYMGSLRAIQQVILPSVAALGGILIPMLIYFMVTLPQPKYHAGWAIPMATDIAFALTVLTVFGKRIAHPMKTFLLTLAIMDDLGAILVIALFHTQNFSYVALLALLVILLVLILLNKLRLYILPLYFALGIALWFATLNAGIHPTIAGVLFAFMIPLNNRQQQPILTKIESTITPWVIFGILPVFAFANAGITFATLSLSSVIEPVTLGIILGLVFGKPLGVFLFSRAYMRLVKLEHTLSSRDLLVIGCVAGIGFTMSLFLADLSFQDASILNLCRLGVLSGSIISAAAAALICFSKSA
jgi:NhaA family Na+:H+ antiporter